jgi:hypothetical protein
VIVVKTRMRGVPKSCSECSFHLSRSRNIYDRSSCGAMINSYGPDGKPINKYNRNDIQTTKERPKWCPLVEATDNDDILVKWLTETGYCTHYPGYTCDKGFPAACPKCIKAYLKRYPKVMKKLFEKYEQSGGTE